MNDLQKSQNVVGGAREKVQISSGEQKFMANVFFLKKFENNS